MIGSTLSHFKITAKLGEGGMGEVYRAEDTKLGREVAIKVLPEAVASDPERLARFEREAKVLAALNHTNIAAIYSLESAAGGVPLAGAREGTSPSPTDMPVHFLVMELVEGEDLRQRLERGAIPLEEALPVALQIAEALDAAHEKGIIHRDLKPANVKLTPDGQVKVLDFGLAKAFDPQDAKTPGPQDLSVSPTLTAQMTGAGIILGTAAYMSPEQARGEEADRRSDIWSFGVLLTEMLTGGPLFNEPTVSDTLAAVLKSDPDLSRMPDDLPPPLLRLIRRCLRKDPRQRLRDIGDVALELREVAGGGEDLEPHTAAEPPPGPTPSSRWTTLSIGLAIGLVLAFAGIQLFDVEGEQEGTADRAVRFTIPVPEGTVLQRGLAISRDSSKIAFLARDAENRTMIWVRQLDSLVTEPVPGTEGAHYPFWSPDGKKIAFLAANELRVVDLIGTPPRALAKVDTAPDSRGGSWGPDDTIIYTPSFSGGVLRIPANGGEPTPATKLDPEGLIGTHRFPWFLPDGEHFVFYASTGTGTEPGEIHLGMLGTTVTKRLTEASSAPVFAAPDQLIFTRGDVLVAQTFDLDQLELVGDPVPLGVNLPGGLAVSGSRSLSASATGTLVFRADVASWSKLVWVSRDGTELATLGDEETWHYFPRISPDGKKVAVSRWSADTDGGDLWVYDRARGLGNPVATGPGDEDLPVWSPDGKRLVFIRTKGAIVGLYTVELGIPSSERQLYAGEPPLFPIGWTPDGASVLVYRLGEESSYDLFLFSVDQPDTPPEPLVASPSGEWNGNFSPDGRWVAFNSDATGRTEVYVRSFDRSGSPWQVSRDGGSEPRFSPDGKELYFVGSDGWIHAAAVIPGDDFRTEDPTPLFDARLDRTSFDRQYDLAPDGTFLLNQRGEETDEPITVIMGLSNALNP